MERYGAANFSDERLVFEQIKEYLPKLELENLGAFQF